MVQTVCQDINGVNSCKVVKSVGCVEVCQVEAYQKYGECYKSLCNKCVDNGGFDNGSGKGCGDYEKRGWCSDGKVKVAWTTGDKYKNPEKHCCVCGGGELFKPPVNPCRDVAIAV